MLTYIFHSAYSDSITSHDKKRHHLESLERYILWLHDQLRIVNQEPASMERVKSSKGLSSRSIRVRIYSHNGQRFPLTLLSRIDSSSAYAGADSHVARNRRRRRTKCKCRSPNTRSIYLLTPAMIPCSTLHFRNLLSLTRYRSLLRVGSSVAIPSLLVLFPQWVHCCRHINRASLASHSH